jgi:hypothetical protein
MSKKLTGERRRKAIIELARARHAAIWQEGEVELDDTARLSEGGDNGVYVEAWVWVPFEGTQFDGEIA